MKQTTNNKRTKTLKIQTLKIPLIIASLISSFLLGCATAKQNNRTVSTVLEKESVLIQKLKEERLQPQIADAVKKDEGLRLAEKHLLMALDELAKANEKVQSTFLKVPTEGGNTNENK